MLEVFLLFSTISLLAESWLLFVFLVVFFWGFYAPYVARMSNFKDFPISEEAQGKLISQWASTDIFVNWLSGGGHWEYSGLSNIPRICFEHYGRKSGKRFIAAVMVYNMRNRHECGVTGAIIGGSNQGQEKLPQWAYNLRAMEEKGELITYNLGRTVYHAEIHEIKDQQVLDKVIPEMIDIYPEFTSYLSDVEKHGRELPIFELRLGAPGTGEQSWKHACWERYQQTGEFDLLRPQASSAWNKVFHFISWAKLTLYSIKPSE